MMLMEKKLRMTKFDKQKHITEICNYCEINAGVSLIDAIMWYCDTNHIEIEYIASIIKKDPALKANLEFEARNLNLLKGVAQLPI